MKKYIFSVLMAAMAAFTFSSCEDVPEPYTLPTQPGAPTTPEVATQGTEASPYTVTDAKTVKTGTSKYIKGYIVGYVPDKALNEAIFGDASSAETAPTNILLAAKADEKEVKNCMPIQLPAGDLRTALNLKNNPGNLKKELIICGNIETYFGATGLKSPVYAKIDGKEIGKKPGDTTTPDTPATGKGSLSDPYNVAEAIAAIKAGTAPTTQVYLTGIISDVAFYNTQYKSITYYISDDGKSKDMQVYSGKGLNGADFASKEDLKVGQKVTILGKIMKFVDKNNKEIMEVDKTSSIVKIEGEGTGGGEVKPDPDPTPGEVATGENGGFENWTDGKPTNWKTASTAGNATLSQSEDAHSGKYSVKVKGVSGKNMRLGYKEITLKAGEYKVKFYVKAATENGASICPGIVPVTDGKVGKYIYGNYVNELKNTEWKLVEQTLKAAEDGTYCFVIMNSGKPGGDILIDDFTVTFGSTTIIK